MKIKRIALATMCIAAMVSGYAAEKLGGTPMGSEAHDYATNQSSTTVNTCKDAFDGDLETYFASEARSYTWVGLDLGEKYVITRVGWSPRNDGLGPNRVKLAMFEGANSPDFMDAVPLYLNPEAGVIGEMHYADVNCSRGFRYVRYVGPNDARCNVAEVEFYGEKGEGDDSRLYQITNLPTVVINTVDAVEPYDKEHDIVSQIIIISENGTKVFDKPGESRLRGNASMQFPKKPYRIKFDKKQNVLDAPAKAKKWTLINNYGDKTLMRNMVAFEIAKRLGMTYVPYIQPVDVVLNGEYKGCYQLCDQVEVNENRVNVTEMEETDISSPNITGGYLIEVDAYADQEPEGTWFTSNKGTPVTIKSPELDEVNVVQQYGYIKGYFNKLEELVYSDNMSDLENGYRSILDMKSFLQHFIVGELSGNTDTYWSTYMYKERNDPKFYVGPVWDFDIAFDNDNRTYHVYDINEFLYASSRSSHASGMRDFVNRIIESDAATKPELKEMWSAGVDYQGLDATSLNEYVDGTATLLDQSQTLNFLRWPILNEYVHQNPQVAGSYAGEIAVLKNYITRRVAQLSNDLIGYEKSAIEDVMQSTAKVKVVGKTIVVEGAEGNVYNIGGSKVAAIDENSASGELQSGIYIVETKDATGVRSVKKIVVR